MKKNIFLDSSQYVPPVRRNAFDKSKLVNGSWRSGYIYPIDWEEVPFGGSVQTNVRAAIRTMPMVWPIQTPIVAKFYQFYVRYRTLCKDFEDFRYNNKEIVHPYIACPPDADFWKTGELGDWLGVPTTYASDHDIQYLGLNSPTLDDVSPKNYPTFYRSSSITLGSNLFDGCSYSNTGMLSYAFVRLVGQPISSSLIDSGFLYFSSDLFNSGPFENNALYVCILNADGRIIAYQSIDDVTSSFEEGILKLDLSSGSVNVLDNGTVTGGIKAAVAAMHELGKLVPISPFYGDYFIAITDYLLANSVDPDDRIIKKTSFTSTEAENTVYYDLGSGIHELKDVNNPFAGVSPEIPLSAFPARAYEMIYRYYFQDYINEPFVIDGVQQYNRYITNDGNGADDTDYHLFRRNWEADPFTSAKPTPQQGLAPIVGVSAVGDITLQNERGENVVVRLESDENDVITGHTVRKEGQNIDQSVRRRLLDLASSGFTINSLRNVNAYQKWVEANFRRGVKFKDQVLSSTGVKLEYKELDVPEFLGGFSVLLNVNAVNQTSSSVEGSPLGDIAGNGGFFGSNKHGIRRFCDEEGIVMTLMCITPIPVYSQMLSKNWLRSNPLDYYNPQFGKIGNQPITYEEVCPVQAYNEGVDVHDVFGYQRPWYHMISSFDEVHGAMRNTMSGFVMQRIFGSTPELGASFLHIDENQMNEVFVVQDGEQDTFYGQIYIDKKVKYPIPRFNVPSLG